LKDNKGYTLDNLDALISNIVDDWVDEPKTENIKISSTICAPVLSNKTISAQTSKNKEYQVIPHQVLPTTTIVAPIEKIDAPTARDAFIFANPVTRGYAEGLRNSYDPMVGVREAAIDLNKQEVKEVKEVPVTIAIAVKPPVMFINNVVKSSAVTSTTIKRNGKVYEYTKKR
jgi:hypothetical protein